MPASPTPPRPKRKTWSDEQIASLTEGTMPDDRVQEALRGTDSRGMTPTSYAVLRTARRTESLTALLTLLDPPENAEQTQIDQVLQLLEGIAEAQLRMEKRLVSIESRLAGRFVASQPQQASARPSSRS